ncbi:MAG: hypothetical protein AB2L14_24430 [Candidatus Xenobiia bacterium LiM19]
MIRKMIVLISMILTIVSVIIIQTSFVSCETSIQPILDANVDADLRLIDIDENDDLAGISHIHEYWKKGKNSVTIDRWIFNNSKEIDAFIKGNLGISFRCNFDEWDKITDIGDKTHWMDPNIVVFAKGKTLIKIWARLGNINLNSKKDYTMKIAKSIAKKL